ncbi:hypothetical protein WA026_016599 [Henosepilachna vigintioctopunctata]|uniref:Uncharacterized protein n=1 Tax=Henosepilachna vigintioctopunctata TaxID=420089 RepID=A0AAW1V9G5_9CUCU
MLNILKLKIMTQYKGLKYAVFIGGLVTTISLALYPIVVDPMINTEKYKQIQKITREGIKQEEIQPGNMKVWSDPFDKKKS